MPLFEEEEEIIIKEFDLPGFAFTLVDGTVIRLTPERHLKLGIRVSSDLLPETSGILYPVFGMFCCIIFSADDFASWISPPICLGVFFFFWLLETYTTVSVYEYRRSGTDTEQLK